MYVVLGATGQTGSAVVSHLLDRKASVRAYVRSEPKAHALRERGVDVAAGTMEDVAALTEALRGATGVYLMLPNDFESEDFVADGERRARGYAEAVRAAGVKRVVGLSSIGAQHASGHGVTGREHRFERAFSDHPGATFVRAGYFVENWAGVLEAAKGAGVLPTFLDPNKAIPMVATADIGATIAEQLLAPQGPRVVELAGPIDPSPNDVAAALGEVLGRTLQVVVEPLEKVAPMFEQLGFSPHIAELVQLLYGSYQAGTMTFEGEPRRGTTALRDTLGKLVHR